MANGPKKRVSGSHVSLSLALPADVLAKLEWEAEAMERYWETDLKGPSYCVINGAISAWQLGDWVAGTLEDAGRWDLATAYFSEPVLSLFDLQKQMRRCSALVACQQIAAAAKHMKINDDGTYREGFQVYEHFDIYWRPDTQQGDEGVPVPIRVLEVSFPAEDVNGVPRRQIHTARLVLHNAIRWWRDALEGMHIGPGASVTWMVR